MGIKMDFSSLNTNINKFSNNVNDMTKVSVNAVGSESVESIDLTNDVTTEEVDFSSGTSEKNEKEIKSVIGSIDSVSGIGEFGKAIGSALKSTGATIGTAVTSLGEGIGSFGESVVDLGAIAGTGIASVGTGLYDAYQAVRGAITGDEWASATKKMWENTKSFVSTNYTSKWFDKFYDTNPVGSWLKNNSYFFDQTRSVSSGIGYIASVVVLTICTAGVGGAVSAGGAGGVSVSSAAAATSASQMAVTAGLAGASRGTQDAWADNAGIVEGLGTGALTGLWEGLQFYLGGKISGTNILGESGNTGIKALNSLSRVILDGVDGGADGIVVPAINSIYKDGYYDDNGNFVKFTSGDTIVKRFAEVFDDNGGASTILTNAVVGSASSLCGEVFDLNKYFKNKDKAKDLTSKSSVKMSDIDVNAKLQKYNELMNIANSKEYLDYIDNAKKGYAQVSRPDFDSVANELASIDKELSDIYENQKLETNITNNVNVANKVDLNSLTERKNEIVNELKKYKNYDDVSKNNMIQSAVDITAQKYNLDDAKKQLLLNKIKNGDYSSVTNDGGLREQLVKELKIYNLVDNLKSELSTIDSAMKAQNIGNKIVNSVDVNAKLQRYNELMNITNSKEYLTYIDNAKKGYAQASRPDFDSVANELASIDKELSDIYENQKSETNITNNVNVANKVDLNSLTERKNEIVNELKKYKNYDDVSKNNMIQSAVDITAQKYNLDDAKKQLLLNKIKNGDYSSVTNDGGLREQLVKELKIYNLVDNLKSELSTLDVNVVQKRNKILMELDKYKDYNEISKNNMIQSAVDITAQKYNLDDAKKQLLLNKIKNGDYSSVTNDGGLRDLLIKELKTYDFIDNLKNELYMTTTYLDKTYSFSKSTLQNLDNSFEIFNRVSKNYGVDQGAIKSNVRYSYNKKMASKNYFAIRSKIQSKYNITANEASIILDGIDRNGAGACSYAATCNDIIHYFLDKPQKFEKIFGYPMTTMVNGKETLNSMELLSDLYIFANDTKNGGSLFEIDEFGQLHFTKDSISNDVDIFGQKQLKSKNQIYISTSEGINDTLINKFLKSKSQNLNFYSLEICNTYDAPRILSDENMEYIKQKIVESSSSGEHLRMGMYNNGQNINMINLSGGLNSSTTKWNEGGGHAVYITGISNDGLFVSSWGQKYLIPFNDLKNGGVFNIFRTKILEGR